jgi:hypothetical protein
LARLATPINPKPQPAQQRGIAVDPARVGHYQHRQHHQFHHRQQPPPDRGEFPGQPQLQRDHQQHRRADRPARLTAGQPPPRRHRGAGHVAYRALTGRPNRREIRTQPLLQPVQLTGYLRQPVHITGITGVLIGARRPRRLPLGGLRRLRRLRWVLGHVVEYPPTTGETPGTD